MNETKSTEKTKVAEVELDVDELYPALRKLKRVTPRSPKDMPILEYALIRKVGPAETDIGITATDIDKATTIELDAEVEQIDREFLIPVYKAWDILKGEDGTVKVEHYVETSTEEDADGSTKQYANHTTVLTVNGVKFDLFVDSEEEYAHVPLAEDTELIDFIEYDRLKDIFYEMTDFALNASETTRHSLTGLQFEDGDVIATNGYYMAIEDLGGFDGEFLLGDTSDIKKQRVTLKKMDTDLVEVRRLKEAGDGQLQILFTDPDHKIQLWFHPIVEEFPEYQAVVPVDNDVELQLSEDNIEKLHKFTSKVDDLTDSSAGQGVRWEVKQDNKTVALSYSHAEVGIMSTEVRVQNLPKADVDITLKAEFTANILDKEDDLSIWLKDSETAALFADNDRMYVQMPISSE